MSTPSLFDIMGPIMIGPSSSHTAGAARLGKMAYKLVGGDIREAKMYLHGSFAATYRGHGTDKALLAGLLNLNPSDERLRHSFELAREKGLRYEFIPTDLGENVHPNTVKFVITTNSGEIHEILGSSIGGGQVVVSIIDGMEVNFTGERPILVTHHRDTPALSPTSLSSSTNWASTSAICGSAGIRKTAPPICTSNWTASPTQTLPPPSGKFLASSG